MSTSRDTTTRRALGRPTRALIALMLLSAVFTDVTIGVDHGRELQFGDVVYSGRALWSLMLIAWTSLPYVLMTVGLVLVERRIRRGFPVVAAATVAVVAVGVSQMVAYWQSNTSLAQLVFAFTPTYQVPLAVIGVVGAWAVHALRTRRAGARPAAAPAG